MELTEKENEDLPLLTLSEALFQPRTNAHNYGKTNRMKTQFFPQVRILGKTRYRLGSGI